MNLKKYQTLEREEILSIIIHKKKKMNIQNPLIGKEKTW